ncbi:hypothetical protein [Capnocytophaga sp.]|uniref:hypothetical protein n=1 Tax=Capnocytophaga sp. TaxID=44737 RepID=UPI0026DCBED1|nr:hypothetical protein [Capnocytophaga sp.]MDO5106279.1 hypothetical protein [Capnocytophaga sp.]
MSTTAKKTKKTAGLNGTTQAEKISKKEQKLRALAEEVQKIFAKHKVKPFNRKELYASY